LGAAAGGAANGREVEHPGVMTRRTPPRDAGFSLTELLMVTAIFTIVAGIAIPLAMTFTEQMRLNAAVRQVERDLQTARLKAVQLNRPLQIRINCPAAGQYRMVEVMGSAIDNSGDRCDAGRYPYPPPDDGDFTTPSADGAVSYLSDGTAFATAGLTVLQFTPDGRTLQVVSGTAQSIPAAGVDLALARGGTSSTHSRTVNINGLGRITIR
jgi:prepilin-type N-terminal cleavage/methylation domain-containing protein